MEYNVFDFDGTIYKGDVTKDFYCFSIRRFPSIWFELPRFLLQGILYWLGMCSKKTLKETFLRFLRHIPSIDELVRDFWKVHLVKMKRFYFERKTEKDIIISASPHFLLLPLHDLVGISNVIATKVDKKTGKIIGENCYGEEKVRRFCMEFPGVTIGCFYSDDLSDLPLSKIAKKSFYVRGNSIMPWNNALQRVG